MAELPGCIVEWITGRAAHRPAARQPTSQTIHPTTSPSIPYVCCAQVSGALRELDPPVHRRAPPPHHRLAFPQQHPLHPLGPRCFHGSLAQRAHAHNWAGRRRCILSWRHPWPRHARLSPLSQQPQTGALAGTIAAFSPFQPTLDASQLDNAHTPPPPKKNNYASHPPIHPSKIPPFLVLCKAFRSWFFQQKQ